jgi:hypothetical protein
MTLKQVIEICELLDDARVDGAKVAALLKARGAEDVQVTPVHGERGSTDCIKIHIRGAEGRSAGGPAPTLGIIGRLGGIGARPQMIGLVSDGDGAVACLAVALKMTDMAVRGDVLPGDTLLATHICPKAPTKPHDPVPMMDSPVDLATLNAYEVDDRMEAILSIDTTKGNRIINHRGFAISPTVKEGYILRVSDDLVGIMEITSGRRARVFPISMQDITPYGNGIYHLNSVLQPCVATRSPVVGVAITAETAVPGCATGASHPVDIEEASRFCIEVGKAFGARRCRFYDEEEFGRIRTLYGPMNRLQTLGGTGSGGSEDLGGRGQG